ncbi:transposase (fragment) [Nitrosomonas mobilis]|uniref:Transposase n=1 Tax=Nitrosomonas mobilis TaxID=51642 RepID=A0A1G5SGF3_9PROT
MIRLLFKQVRILTACVSESETQLSKDCHNSSTPPSFDELKKTRPLRRPSGAKSGGQIRHKGMTLKRVREPGEVIEHGLPERCDGCGETSPLSCAQIVERRQVFDIPVVRYEATGHRTLRLQCGCGKLHESQFLSGVRGAVQYEPNIRALAVHLKQGQLLPLARSAQLIDDLYELEVSPATLLA